MSPELSQDLEMLFTQNKKQCVQSGYKISESYLNSDTSSNDNNLDIAGYMSLADHPFGNQHGGVCIYYKESSPVKMLNINYLQECICFDLKIGSKPCTIVSLDHQVNLLMNLIIS